MTLFGLSLPVEVIIGSTLPKGLNLGNLSTGKANLHVFLESVSILKEIYTILRGLSKMFFEKKSVKILDLGALKLQKLYGERLGFDLFL